MRAVTSWPHCGRCSQRWSADAGGPVSGPGARYRPVPSHAGAGSGLRPGDLLLEDRGFLDGQRSRRERTRKVDVIIPLKPTCWRRRRPSPRRDGGQVGAHPSRAEQRIAWVRGVEHMWPECHVPLNACVIRFWIRRKRTDHIVW